MTQINDPVLWKHLLPILKADGHKYDRGVAVIYGSPSMTGATRLAAEACARIGAGLVKVIAPQGTGAIYRAALPAHIVVEDEEFRTYTVKGGEATYQSSHHHFMDEKCRAVLMGPGTSAEQFDRMLWWRALEAEHIHGIVLDAGAFTAWSGDMMLDLQAFSSSDKVAVTPHDGEFQRFFNSFEPWRWMMEGSTREEQAKRACEQICCTVVLKGAETIVADSLRHAVTHKRPMPNLATAGTGDVLAGMITGLLAQGMPMAAACAAAVWTHSEAASKFGKGLVASDLPDLIPVVMQNLE